VKAIYHPFQRPDTSLVRKHEGSEPGISIKRGLINLYGGRPEIKS
jgi:hypothetical protein